MGSRHVEEAICRSQLLLVAATVERTIPTISSHPQQTASKALVVFISH